MLISIIEEVNALHIDGKTQLLGVLGQGIDFTLSPAINNFSARYLQLNSIYIPLQLSDSAALTDALRFLQASNFIGLNVTTPFKQSIARLLSSSVPSINVLARGENNSLCATSTDGQGFWQALAHTGCQRDALHTAIILGNGGVCAALLDFFANLPLPHVIILRRNTCRDQALAAINAGRCQLSFADFSPQQLQCAITANHQQLLVQASSAPLHGDDLQRFCPALDNFCGTLVDLIYTQPSALYHTAQARHLKCQDGLPMLIEQARLGQQIWWGKCAPYAAIAKHLHDKKSFTNTAIAITKARTGVGQH